MNAPPLVRVLGEVAIHTPQGYRPVPGRLDRAVLLHLVLAANRSVSVDLLTDALWGDHPPTGARNALQVKVSRLRVLLGDQADRLTWSQGAYRLRLEPDATDVARFEATVRAGEQAWAEGRSGDARADLAEALALWPGDLLPELAGDPTVTAERHRLEELHATALETYAEVRLADPSTRSAAIADLRHLLERQPLRARARRTLMEGLDLSGRRADALAVYDAGRRLHLQSAGLEPPAELARTFDRLLAAEREETRRVSALSPAGGSAPDGLLDSARWLADQGDVPGALNLAVRGAWWWWMRGARGPARALLEDLVGRSADDGLPDGPVQLTARVWLDVFASVTARAGAGLREAEETLQRAARAWSRPDATAAVLVAERLFERGEPQPARRLLRSAARHFGMHGDPWGQAICGVVLARSRLQAGDIDGARSGAEARLRDFGGLADDAGQMMALDLLGTCAEVRGDLALARTLHRRALAVARRVGSPDWEAAQLTRLGNVGTLAGDPDAVGTLESAARLSDEIGSETVGALARNGLGLALEVVGDRAAARDHHETAWAYYDAAGSPAGRAYTAARLSWVGADSATDVVGQPADAWARASLTHALTSRDPRATALSLESLALTSPDQDDATRALAAADRLRESAGARVPTVQADVLGARRRVLVEETGRRFVRLTAEGREAPERTARVLAT